MAGLLGLFFVLTLITLIGHGIWVIIRAALKAIRGLAAPDGPRGIDAVMCPDCGEAWPIASGVRQCPACNWPGPRARGDARRARAAVGILLQRIERYRESGLLAEPISRRIAEAIIAERDRVGVSPRDPAVSAAPSQPPPRPTPRPEPSPAGPEPRRPKAPRDALAAQSISDEAAREAGPSPRTLPEAAEPGPRASLGSVLGRFMEERNLRWGELVGGLLIVGCSLALVLGYWDRIAERPILRFGLANGVIAAFFAVGLHAERRWRLPTTAHGLILVATLLVPLGVLSMISVGGDSAGGIRLLVGEAIALAAFFALIGRSGRSMASISPWTTAAGVVLPSAALLAAGRWAVPGAGEATRIALGVLPLLAHAAATLRGVIAHRVGEMGEPEADDLLRTLGTTAFAAAVALGAMLGRFGDPADTLRQWASLAPLAGTPALAAGLTIWRRAGATLPTHRVAGGAIASAGTMVMLAGVACAWPGPARIVAVATFDGLALIAVALAFELPAAIAIGGVCLALGCLVTLLGVIGALPWGTTTSTGLAEALVSSRSGVGLLPIALLFQGATLAVLRAGRREEARALSLVAGLAGIASLALVSWHGFAQPGDPVGATWVYAVLAAATLAGSAATARTPLFDAEGSPPEPAGLAWAGSALLLAALVQGFVFRQAESWGLSLPWSSALLGHATISAGLARMGRSRRAPGEGEFGAIRGVLSGSALLTSSVAALLLAWRVPVSAPSDLAVYLLWLSAVWLFLAGFTASRRLFWAFQAALTASVGFAVAGWASGRPWFGEGRKPWLDPRILQAESIALALLGLAWIGVRLGAKALGEARPKDGRIEASRRLMEPPWPTFDRYSTWAAVLVLVGLAAYGAIPGAAQELSPRSFAAEYAPASASGTTGRPVPPSSAFELLGLPHEPALGIGSWLLLASALATLLAGQWERFRRLDLLGAMVVAAATVPLAAGRWEEDVAVASAMRWGGAIGAVALSAPIWARGRLCRLARRIGWEMGPGRTEGLRPMAIGLVVALAAIPLLSMIGFVAGAAFDAHPIRPDLATAWRWSGIAFVAMGTAGTLILARSGGIDDPGGRTGASRVAGGLVVALGALAIVAVSALVVGASLSGDPVVGPEPGSFFDRIGPAGSYAIPIVLAALTLVGYAIRERSAGFALASGLLLGFGATVGWLLSGAIAARPGDPTLWIRLAQLNAIVGSAFALAWMGCVEIWARRRAGVPGGARGPALMVQVAIPVSLIGLILIGGVLDLFLEPGPTPPRSAIADPFGWVAFLLTAGASGLLRRRPGTIRPGHIGCAAVVGIAAMLAFGAAARDQGDWRTYHAMMALQSVAAGGLILFGWNRRGMRVEVRSEGDNAITRWSSLATLVVTAYALNASGPAPGQSPWWGVGGLLVAAILWASLAAWSAGRWPLYLAGVLINLAASSCWFDDPGGWLRGASVNLLVLNVIALAAPAPAWLWIELKAIRPVTGRLRRLPPFHRVAAWVAMIALTSMVSAWLIGDAAGGWAGPEIGLGAVLAIGSVALALAVGLWDDRSRGEVAGLYLLGLSAAGWLVAGFDPDPGMMAWVGAVVLACHAVVAGALWSARDALRRIADRLGVPRSSADLDPEHGLGWLVPANLTLSAGIVALAFVVTLTNGDMLPRFSAAKAGLATALAIGLLARGERRSLLRATALGFGAAGALAWGWAWIDPGSPTATLDRAAATMVALTATAAGFGLGLVSLAPRATRWGRAARRLVPSLLGLAGFAMLAVIGAELAATAGGRPVAMSAPALVASAATMLGAVAAALVAAVVPGRDPLRLPERRRTIYVYGAEALLALLAMHLGLTMPWLFSGIFARYWPVIVLGIAFAGVGLGEVFRRQGRLVLADPLERTGALLPILPLLGASWLEPRPGEDTLFLVLAGGLYATLSLLRSSAGFGAMAALAFNAGLWTVLGRREGFGLLEHPQFWVVPPALCILAGVFMNRDRLGEGRSVAMRYAASGAVYLSSTTDLVLNGVGEDPWLPLVLGGLSLLGIFAGIALRVRGFLLLGVGFLGLSIFAIIWYAAVDLRQTWLWAASGIIAGILILAAFALFERRRGEVVELVGRLRDWEP
ncbi:hypothetical protein [Tautonia plasticadhaerens]|uniref:Uncharacterized protein n=1 Tax=Tautonia plasticadhaerens TaxID=2527974 RepID=A0A518GVG2_9BACT|nr:hypothetical protein [Tautonia plasticadhaerens]QDV32576.1 hypothetical protein ElP_04100 [Tautonia plasticadhaerens]